MTDQHPLLNENKCPMPATHLAPWGGKFVHGCKAHITDLAVISRIIGHPLDIVQIKQSGVPCYGLNDFADRIKAKEDFEKKDGEK